MSHTITDRPESRARRSMRGKPIMCPQTPPVIWIGCMMQGMIHMRYSDQFTQESSKKPFGAKGLQLFVAIGDHERNVEDARYCRTYTRSPFKVEFDYRHDGKVATFYARWVSARGETGLWSLPESMRIAV